MTGLDGEKFKHWALAAVFVAGLGLSLGLSACATSPEGPTAAEQARADSAWRGRVVAREHCASCHGIEPGAAASPNVLAPTFEAVANTPGMTHIAFNVWMNVPHPTMPDYVVAPGTVDDLWTYMVTLRADDE